MVKDKVALVTGASRGIGKSVAKSLAEEGALVGVNGTNPKNIERTVEEIRSLGGKAIGIRERVETMEGAERIVHTLIETFGTLDILIHNAGVVRDRMTVNMTEDEWDDVIQVNLKGAFACIRPAIKHMKANGKGGHILSMTSTAGLMGSVGQVNYSAAKAGILGMTWTLAQELSRYGIRVNAVAPAALTDMTRPVIEKIKAEASRRNENVPDFWKVGRPEHVAKLVLYLLSEENRELSGEVFSVNGDRIGVWEKPRHKILCHDPHMTSRQFGDSFRKHKKGPS